MIEDAVSNSSCLIALERVKSLELLHQSFKNVFIPPAVEKEFGRTLKWLTVKKIKNQAVVSSLSTQIGNGESEAIALAMQVKDCILILDDKRARRIARQLELKVLGNCRTTFTLKT